MSMYYLLSVDNRFIAGVACILLSLSIGYGFQYRFQGDDAIVWFATNSVIFLLGLLLVSSVLYKYDRNHDSHDLVLDNKQRAAGAILSLLSLALSIFFNTSNAFSLLLIVVAILSFFIGLRIRGYLFAIRSIFLLAFILAIAHVLSTPLDSSAADMLPIIKAACNHVLQGGMPYGVVFPEASVFPFVYLPGSWLPYLPFVALDLDPRVLNLIAYAAIVLVAEIAVLRCGGDSERLAILFYPLLMSPVMAQAIVYGHVWSYWMMAVVLGYLLIRFRLYWSAFVIGLMLATRQWAVFIALPVVIYYFFNVPPKRFIGLAGVVCLGFSTLLLPSVLYDENFVQAAFLDVFASAKVAAQGVVTGAQDKMALQVSAVALFKALQVINHKMLFLMMVAAVAFTSFRSRTLPDNQFVFFLGLVYILLVTVNFQVFRYYYVPGLLLIGIAFACFFTWSPRVDMNTSPEKQFQH